MIFFFKLAIEINNDFSPVCKGITLALLSVFIAVFILAALAGQTIECNIFGIFGPSVCL